MDMPLMRKNAARFRKLYPKNRLVRHLAVCACKYGCPAAINFFLERYECPLPVSRQCNSLCVGCISVGHSATCPATQPRIKFLPNIGEISQAALHHIKAVRRPVVSFGQGCEGEPLTVAHILQGAIAMIRRDTKRGVINLNTNASRPKDIERLRSAGLDSIRVSINSVRKRYYNAYYKPIDYNFEDVIESIKSMKRLGGFVSINYLVMPGFTDQKQEQAALFDFIKKTKIDMIQWRNLNYDPVDYFRKLNIDKVSKADLVGIKEVIEETKRRFPQIRHGYFNPRNL
jgi:molybdenum cofactor biosynthesis enzyme MoaA